MRSHRLETMKRAALVSFLVCIAVGGASAQSTSRWTGASAAGGNWTDAANWAGGAPSPGNILWFPSGAARLTNTNNFPADTQFNRIDFTGTDYILRGNRALLTGINTNLPLGSFAKVISAGLSTTNRIELSILLNKTNSQVEVSIGTIATSWLIMTGDIFLTNNVSCNFAAGRFWHTGSISGQGRVMCQPGADVLFTGLGANTHDGVTGIGGKVGLDRAGGFSVPGDWTTATVGLFPFPQPADATWFRPDQVADFGEFFAYGTYFLSGFNETVGDMFGFSEATINNGTISLNGNLTAGNLVPDPPFTLKGTGRLGFNAGDHLIVQTNIYSAIMMDLTVTGPGHITKTGTNALFLTRSNNFSGAFTILDGPVVVSNSWSLGSPLAGTTVGPGGSLVLGAHVGIFTLNDEPLIVQPGGSLSRHGFFTAVYAGPVTLPGPGSTAIFTNPSLIATYVNLNRAITGAGGVTIAGNIEYTGTGNNTYAGPTLVRRGELVLNKPGLQAIAGTLVIGDDDPLDAEEFVTSLASEQIANAAEVIIHNGSRWNLGGQVETIARLSGGTATNGGIMQLTTLASALIVGSGGSDFHFAGQFAGEGYLEKIGFGTGILSGNSSGYNGQTTINEGALDIRGNLSGSTVSIIPGARLTGSGAIGDLFAQNGGIYEPGRTGLDGLNTLTSSNLNLAPGAVLRIPIWGSATGQYGKASVRGIVNLTNAVLDIVMMTPPVVGTSYRIIENDGVDLVNGTFAGLPGGDFTGPGGLLWNIEYDNDVTITLLSQGQSILPPSLEGEEFLDIIIEGGNGDGYADPNECIDVFIPLFNDTMQTNPVIAAMLSSPHPELIVLQSYSLYPETEPGEGNYNLSPFKVSVPTNFLCGTNLPLVLTIKNGTNALYGIPVGLPTGKPADTPVRYDSSGPLAIPDESTLIDLVFVQNFTGHLAKVEVSLHITHPALDTLKVTLVGPGEIIQIPLALSQPGTSYGSGCADPSRTEFTADAATFIGNAAAPYVGTFRPEGILPLVRGMAEGEVNNRWYLWVEDTVTGNVGTLECWSLFLYPAECDDGGGMCPRCPEPIEDTIETDGPMAFARLVDLDTESPPTSCFEGPGAYIEAPGSYYYQSYSYYNLSTNDVCVVVTLETACLGVDSIISMAYLGKIDPLNVSANLLGFMGQPPTSNTPQRIYSFIAPAESHVTVVVMGINSGEGCKGYTLYVDAPDLCTPELFIWPAGDDKVRLDWSTNHVGFLLHKNTSMMAPTNWVFVPDTPVVLDGHFVVTNQPVDPEAFFRLFKP